MKPKLHAKETITEIQIGNQEFRTAILAVNSLMGLTLGPVSDLLIGP